MAPCLTTSGNVSNTFPEFESFPGGTLADLNQDPEPNELDLLSEDWSPFDPSIICPDIFNFSVPDIPNILDAQLNESENIFDFNQHLSIKSDVFLRSNDDSPQDITCKSNGNEACTSDDIPSHLFDHCYIKYTDSDAENETSNNECSEAITEEETDICTSEKTVTLPVSIPIQNNQGRGQRRVRNNVRLTVEKKKNETCSRGRKRKNKVEKDEETRSRHNRMERQRRHDMKHSFQYLASIISDDKPLKYSKVNLLKKARKVIKELEDKERRSSEKLRKLKNKRKELKKELLRLRKQK